MVALLCPFSPVQQTRLGSGWVGWAVGQGQVLGPSPRAWVEAPFFQTPILGWSCRVRFPGSSSVSPVPAGQVGPW